MTDEALYTALRNADAAGDTEAATRLAAYIRQQSAPKAEEKPPGGSLTDQIGRQLGLTGRYALEGAGNLAGIVSDPVGQFLPGYERTGQMASQAADALGLPKPQGGLEQAVAAGSKALVGTGLTAGLGAAAGAPALATAPGLQAASATAGGISSDVARQEGAGTLGQIAAGLVGAIAPAAGAPIVSKVASALTTMTESEALQAGKALAKDAGLSGLSDQQLTTLGRMQSQVAGGADPAALAAQAKYNLQLTKGQRLQEGQDFQQLAAEERLRNSASPGGDILRQAQTGNTQKVQDAYSQLVNQVGGGQAPSSVPSAMEQVQQAIQSNAASLKGKVGAAYEAANTKDAFVAGEPLADLQARAVGAVNLVDNQLTPATVKALQDVGQTAGKGAMRLDQIDVMRRRLSDLATAGANPTDTANVLKIKKSLDGWLDDAMDNALIQGDQNALSQLKDARALRTAYGQKFQGEDKGGQLVQAMLQQGKSPEELAGLALGAQQVSNAASGSVAKAVRNALTDSEGQLNQEAWDQFRSSVLLKMGERNTGDALGLQALQSNIKTTLNSRPTLVKELYTPEEQSALGNLSNAIDYVLPSGDFARSSGTAERALRYVTSTAAKFPIIGKLVSGLASIREGQNAMAPIAPPAPSGFGPQTVPSLVPQLEAQ